MVYPISRYLLKFVNGIFVKEVQGINNLPKEDSFILAVNHSSYLDPALIYAAVVNRLDKKIHSIGAKYLFKKRLWDLIYRVWWEAIPLNGAVEKAIKYLEKGEIVCVFPEGGRTATGEIGKSIGSGVAVMALTTGKSIVPVYIEGSFDVWPKTQKLPSFEKIIKIKIGKPIKFKKSKINKVLLSKTMNKVINEIKKLK